MVWYGRLDFTHASKVVVCVSVFVYRVPTEDKLEKGNSVAGSTEISIFFIILSIKLHDGEIWFFFLNLYFQAAQIPKFF